MESYKVTFLCTLKFAKLIIWKLDINLSGLALINRGKTKPLRLNTLLRNFALASLSRNLVTGQT